jgi:hypothetical protein
MSIEVPLEIAQTAQITWSMTPFGTPARPMSPENNNPEAPNCSPNRPIPALRFGVNSLPHPSHVSATATSDIFGDLVTAVEATKAEPPSDDLRSSVQGVQSGALSPPPSPPPVKPEFQSTPSVPLGASSPRVRSPPYTHRSTGTFGVDFPIYDNEIAELDPCWPTPIYPLMPGQPRPDPPPPNIAIAPKKYYVLTKGLRLGVYYDEW